MNKGIYLLISAVPVAFFLLINYSLKQPFVQQDYYIFIKSLLLFVSAYVFLTFGKEKETGKHSGLNRVFELVGIAAACFGGIFLLHHGFMLYHSFMMWKGLFFFVSGLVVVFVVFYVTDKQGSDIFLNEPVYKPVKVIIPILKIVSALMLALLGFYFIKKNMAMLACAAYLFMFLQLVLIIKKPLRQSENDAAAVLSLHKREPGTMIATLVLMAAAFVLYYYSITAMNIHDIKSAMTLFVIGALVLSRTFVSGMDKPGLSSNETTPKLRLFDLSFAIFIFIAGLIILGWRLMEVPPGIHGDEALSVMMAKRLAQGQVLPVVIQESGYSGLTLLYFWIYAMVGKIFGITILTGRWFSVITGSAGLVFVYLLVRDIFNRRAAVLTSMLLSVFFMWVFYSRNAILWIHVPAFAAASYYFFFKGMRDGRPLNFVLSGMILAANLCFYSAAKASPMIPAVWIIIMALRKETRVKITSNWKGLSLMFFTMLLIFLPVLDYIMHDYKDYFLRMKAYSLLGGLPDSAADYKLLAENMLRNIQMFITQSANGYAHNLPQKPFFDMFASLALFTGAAFLLGAWKRGQNLFVILWLFFGLLPGFLSKLGPEDPYPARTVLAIPALILIISLGVERVLTAIESMWPKILKYLALFGFVYFFAWFAYTNIRNYFVVFANDPHTQVYYRIIDKVNADYMLKNQNRKIIITPYLNWNYYFGMYNELSDPSLKKFVQVDDISLFEMNKIYDAGRPVTIIGEGIYGKLLPLYREYFPSAKLDTVWDPNFWQFDLKSDLRYCYEWRDPEKTMMHNYLYHWFYIYDADVNIVRVARAEISNEDIRRVFTLKAGYYKKGVKVSEGDVTLPLIVPGGGFDRVVLSGLIDIPDYGNYEFTATGVKSGIFVDGRHAAGSVKLYKGLHRLKASFENPGNTALSLYWKPSGSASVTAVEQKYLVNSEKIFGLLATYKNKGSVIYKALEPMVNYRMYYYNKRPAFAYTTDNGYQVEWDGFINIRDADTYQFKLHSLYDCVIRVDGRVLYEKIKGKENFYPARLEKGMRKLSIKGDYTYISNYWDPGSTLRFMYKRPAWGEFGPVPYDCLSPGI